MEKLSNGYYNEIQKGQLYDVYGEIYQLTEFRVTCVRSPTDFITCAFFKSQKPDSENPVFEEQLKNIIKDPGFKIHQNLNHKQK